MVKIGADPTFKTPVGAEMDQKRRRDSPIKSANDGDSGSCPE